MIESNCRTKALFAKKVFEGRVYNLKPVGDQRIRFKDDIKIIIVNTF